PRFTLFPYTTLFRSYAVLWPRDSDKTSRKLRAEMERRYRKRLGILIVDSRVTPLRLGTIGLALGCAGFAPVHDLRGSTDLYGRRSEEHTSELQSRFD